MPPLPILPMKLRLVVEAQTSPSANTPLDMPRQAPQVEGLRVYSTITNLFDKVPPIFPTQGGRTGFGSGVLGDVLGRRYVVGAEYKF